tara:strand:- start:39 stop:479 length:441 start_codon:yes stop_codon:yes gene_type:complete
MGQITLKNPFTGEVKTFDDTDINVGFEISQKKSEGWNEDLSHTNFQENKMADIGLTSSLDDSWSGLVHQNTETNTALNSNANSLDVLTDTPNLMDISPVGNTVGGTITIDQQNTGIIEDMEEMGMMGGNLVVGNPGSNLLDDEDIL